MNATEQEHEAMVSKLVKDGKLILSQLTPSQVNLLHMAIGISGEAGELLDAIKKHVFYQKPLDTGNVVEELGDLEFYMRGMRQELDVWRNEVLDGNIKKLSKRYEGFKYSDQAAQQRADKV